MTKYFACFGLPGSLVLTMLMSALALVLAVVFRSQDRWLCLMAMLLSSVGDVILMNWRGIGHRLPIPGFYAGAMFFILAHFVYTAAYAGMIRRNGYSYRNAGFWIALSLIVLIGVTVTVMCLRRIRVNWTMYGLCIVYLCVIGCMLATVFSFAWSVRGWRSIAAVGALSFFLSDLIIGLDRLLYITTPRLQGMIWELYPVGQILLLLCG